MAGVTELTYYPVKGCAGVSVREAVLTPSGLPHDRCFMVVSEDGDLRYQVRDPRLALIRPAVGAGGDLLTLRAPGVEPLELPVDPAGAPGEVRLSWGTHQVVDQGAAAAEWLTEVLHGPSRLVRVATANTGSRDLHVVGRSTLELLNRRLAERGEARLPMNRFRPNLVVDGWEPHTEDRVRRVGTGGAELEYTELSLRCAITMVEQESGRKAGPEPLRTLAGYRRTKRGPIAFGVNFAVRRPGKVAVGDLVEVAAWGESEA